jgi:DNA-binding transcriptional LysR family regulator
MTPEERIGRRLSLRALNMFLVVAEKRSMSRAAEQLAISQPVVSKAIADMEYMFGVPLLDRNPRGVEPTLYGRALIKRGMAVFDELRQSVKDIEFLTDPAAGDARIGATPPLAAGMVPVVVETLMRRHPRAQFDLVEGDFGLLQNGLHDRDFDVVIGRAPAPITDDRISSEVLFDDQLLVVAGSRNKWTRRKQVQLSELCGEPWTFPPAGTVAGTLVAEVFLAMGIKPPRTAVTTGSIAMVIHLLVSSDILALLPASMVVSIAKHQSLRALPVALPHQPRPIVIATLKNRTLSPVAQLFINYTSDLTRSLMAQNRAVGAG